MAVVVNGVVLSSLFFEHLNAHCDQEGFFLGSVVRRTVTGVSDVEPSTATEEVKYHVEKIVPTKLGKRFYNKKGEVIEEMLQNLLGTSRKDVIGWYRFRQNSTLQLSLYERLIHYSLGKYLSAVRQANSFGQPPFVGLFTYEHSSNRATHTFEQVFLRQATSGDFLPMPMSIVNLSCSSTSQYLNRPPPPVQGSSAFDCIMADHRKELVNASGQVDVMCAVRAMADSVQDNLKALMAQVGESDRYIVELRADIARMQSQSGYVNNMKQEAVHPATEDGIAVSEQRLRDENIAEKQQETNSGLNISADSCQARTFGQNRGMTDQMTTETGFLPPQMT